MNMCDALANLPTDLGIEAIETFSRRASTEPVRNKTGFMVNSRYSASHLMLPYASHTPVVASMCEISSPFSCLTHKHCEAIAAHVSD